MSSESSPTATSVSSGSSSTGSQTSPKPTSSPTSKASSSSSAAPTTHTVKAGSGGWKFEPAELKNVSIGDTVTFEFYPPDHSVARAEYMSPCVPYEYTGKDKVGFWSDTQWVDTVNDITHYSLKINSTEPIFYYCAAPKSCKDRKMIGVINPNSTQTLEAQSKAAGESSFQLKPGDPIPKEASHSMPNSPTGLVAPPSSDSNHHGGISGGAIAGIVVGAVAFLVMCAALFFYVGRAKSLKEMVKHKDKEAAAAPPPPPPPPAAAPTKQSDPHMSFAPSSSYRGASPEPHASYNAHSSYRGASPDPYRSQAGTYPGSHPGSPGPYPGSPSFSTFPSHSHAPSVQHTDYNDDPPMYGQHNATDSHLNGYSSAHTSMTLPPMGEQKNDHTNRGPVELGTEGPSELEDTHKKSGK